MEELKRFFPYAALFIIIMFLIAIVQNDLGQVVVLALTLAFMLFFRRQQFSLFLDAYRGVCCLFPLFYFYVSTPY